MTRAAEIMWRPLFLGSPLIPLLLYFQGTWYGLAEAYSLSMLLGIVAYIYLMNTLILSSRLKWLDRMAGHDRVIRFHRQLSVIALLLSLLHGLVKSRVFPSSLMPAPLGIGALVLFFATGLGALLFLRDRSGNPGRRRPDYSLVKALHNLTVPAAVVAAVHVLLAATTAEQGIRFFLMGIWGALAVSLWVRHKLIRPLILSRRGHRVCALDSQDKAILEIKMERGRFGDYRAGQFVYLRFPSLAAGGEEHPFTLSSAPSEDVLAVTVKVLGDYTAGLKELKTGDPVIIDGPYGKFCPGGGRALIFLAGGIGITPFISSLREILPSFHHPLVLFWSVRNPDELVYDRELRRMEEEYSCFNYYPTVTGEGGEGLMRGRIDRNMILRLTDKDVREQALWYCCGPAAMMETMKKVLKGLEVSKGNIRTEGFSY